MFIPKYKFRNLVAAINQELGQALIRLGEIKPGDRHCYFDALLIHDKDKATDIFAKCKCTKALQDFEKKHQALLKLDNYQLKIGF